MNHCNNSLQQSIRISKCLFSIKKDLNSNIDKATNRLTQACFINQESSGIFQYNNFGLRVLHKINNVIRKHLNKKNFLEVSLPILQDIKLWEKSGRINAYGKEKFILKDRKNTQMVIAPTAEESSLMLVSKFLNSYKQLPIVIYQILEKYRDEIRPRFGLIRSRQFTMKDAYSFAKNKEESIEIYHIIKQVYTDIFKELELKTFIVQQTDTGEIGGDLSHEFVIKSDIGETDFYYNEDQASYKAIYQNKARCLELGHIFHFETLYSDKMDIKFTDVDNKQKSFYMGSYGIGVTRLISALACNNEFWPTIVSPFDIHLITLNNEEDLYEKLSSQLSILYDDRNKSMGTKFNDADLIGIPYKIIIGKNIEFRYKNEVKIFNLFDDLYKIIEQKFNIKFNV